MQLSILKKEISICSNSLADVQRIRDWVKLTPKWNIYAAPPSPQA